MKDVVSVDQRDVLAEGFPEAGSTHNPDGCHAVMIDLPQPWAVIPNLPKCFTASGGRVCVFSPCIEQIQKSCNSLRSAGFTQTEVFECVSRNYDFVHSVLNVPNFGQKSATDLLNGTYVFGKSDVTEETNSVGKTYKKHEPHLYPPLDKYLASTNGSKGKHGNREDGCWVAVPRHKDTGHTGYLAFASYIPMCKTELTPSTAVTSTTDVQGNEGIDQAMDCSETNQ
ncbi:unnamed protein product [Rodentolepis nana]|uniref:tRNA (adenine(58)-N(1))-methyltransferase n=1 Tax=Rodentolepis nana TaxID=102285 RepID=A0A3P7TFV9_RODNA|nr:unnamed protein product [Rodentolepis nana]